MHVDLPSDIESRRRFILETDRNFSVIAPAGVGKTTAIVERIAHFALNTANPAADLPKLVVVTYTNKAADEMQQRARNEILTHPQSSVILPYFNRAFFGTIHSFCLHLLNTFGCFLGLPPGLIPVSNDEDLWNEFVRGCGCIGDPLSAQQQADLFRNLPPHQVLELARHLPPAKVDPTQIGDLPLDSAEQIQAFEPNKRNAENVQLRQKWVSDWLKAARSEQEFHPIPELEKGGKDFVERGKQALGPIRDWIGHAAHAVASCIASKFQRFRIERGVVSFDDHISLAAQLVAHPAAGAAIRSEEFRILLDEAQDTDPLQFRVLLECARPENATDDWLDSDGAPPETGRFSMVGDPQQSIYGDRADLGTYLRIQDRLVDLGAAETLEFETTFRCDQAIIDFVNASCTTMLDGEDGQVDLVHLLPRPGVLPGQVVRLDVGENPQWATEDGKVTREQRLAWEAKELIRWIRGTGLQGLRANCWSEVAILCPRKRLFQPLAHELEREGMRFQTQSNRDIMGDSPAYAWLAALAHVLSHPADGFEIVGVLREVYGISDDALARWSQQGRRPFRIDVQIRGDSAVDQTLRSLAELRRDTSQLPLRETAECVVHTTRLAARLAELTEYNALTEQSMITRLLTDAGEAETRGLTLSRWSEELRRGFFDPTEGEAIQPEAIQLMTCQKAKGLQWQAVIVPFLFNEIRESNPNYPRVLSQPGSGIPTVALDKDSLCDEDAAKRELRKSQELERILYVAMTRAKHSLVLVDDSQILDGKRNAFGQLLGLGEDGPNRSLWASLATHANADLTTESQKKIAIDSNTLPSKITEKRASFKSIELPTFPLRVLPHSLAKHGGDAEPEVRREAMIDEEALSARESAIEYGLWWHSLCEHADWSASSPALEAYFTGELQTCSDPARAQSEWDMLMKSDLLKHLSLPHLTLHREVPFSWKKDSSTIIEGIIDLAIFDINEQRWQVIDWKTDRTAPDQINGIMENYLPQIASYAAALEALTGRTATGGIYSTATGIWIKDLHA